MIIGKGLLAKSFKEFEFDGSTLIFASGVSNSQETDTDKFNREINLLYHYVKTKLQLIYFSTVSICDPSLKDTQYILHKNNIEKIIMENCNNYLIFRLPVLVSHSDNGHTLTNFLFNKICKKQSVPVFEKACRYLLDIDDATLFLSGMIKSNTYRNEIININLNNPVNIGELVSIFEQVLKIKANRLILKKGEFYQTDNKIFLQYLNDIQFNPGDVYIFKTIEKYYANRCR